MKDWLHRHVQLTREERLLVAAIILILLLGIAAWQYRQTASGGEEIAAPVGTAPVAGNLQQK